MHRDLMLVLDFYSGSPGFKVYSEDGEEFKDLEEEGRLEDILSKGSQVEMTVRCSSIWLTSGRFGLTWDVSAITVYPAEGLDAFDPAGVFGNDDGITSTLIEDTTEMKMKMKKRKKRKKKKKRRKMN